MIFGADGYERGTSFPVVHAPRRCEHNTIRFSVTADGSWRFPEPSAWAAD